MSRSPWRTRRTRARWAPLSPARVSRLNVKVGDTVEKNQTLVTIEAMKMETAITARMSGTVSEILVKEGETVKGGQLIWSSNKHTRRRPAPVGPAFRHFREEERENEGCANGLAEILKNCKKNLVKNEDKV